MLPLIVLSLFLLPPANLAAASDDEYLKLPLLRKSPLPSPTQALALDTRRLHFLSLRRKPIPFVKSPVFSGASSGSGQYFVDLRIGQPPQSLLLIADTGSDLVWVKCSACRNCSLHSPATVFFPRHSSTFSPTHCYDPTCRLAPEPSPAPKCNHTRLHSTCPYEYAYADGSSTSGLFARETATLKTSSGREANLKSVAFGCGFRISGQTVSGTSFNGAHGVLGLGRGPISFASQLGRRFGDKFSYCLMDSSTSGLFARETATLRTSSGRDANLKRVAFGCGFRISGQTASGTSFNGAHGVLGLGRGPISFASQLGRRFGDKFSYCLMDYTLSPPPTSYLTIGGARTDVVSKLSFTPLLTNPLSPTFYYVRLKSISVNGARLRIDPSVWEIDGSGNGGTVVDSGTTLAFLADPAYRLVVATMRRRIRLPIAAEPTPGFDLCVNVSNVLKPEKMMPRLKFGFSGGAVFVPPPRNYFIETEEHIQCLAIQSVNPKVGFSVIGNLMQQGFLFEFDRERSRLGFSRRGCSSP